jgi:hypothetical protein
MEVERPHTSQQGCLDTVFDGRLIDGPVAISAVMARPVPLGDGDDSRSVLNQCGTRFLDSRNPTCAIHDHFLRTGEEATLAGRGCLVDSAVASSRFRPTRRARSAFNKRDNVRLPGYRPGRRENSLIPRSWTGLPYDSGNLTRNDQHRSELAQPLAAMLLSCSFCGRDGSSEWVRHLGILRDARATRGSMPDR